MIHLKTLKWEDHPGLFGWVLNLLTKVFIGKKQRIKGDRRRYEDGTLLTSKVDKGGHDPEDELPLEDKKEQGNLKSS